MGRAPIAEGLFMTDEPPRLLGGRRKADGRIVFPMPQGADAALYDLTELSPTGRLWSYTIQRFRPKSPPYAGDDETTFTPFAVGYVELPGQVIVESRIDTDDFSTLKIGQPMELALIPFRRVAGGEVLTYAFRPTSIEGAAQ